MKIIDFHTHPFLSDNDSMQWHTGYNRTHHDEFRKELESLGILKVCGSIIKRGIADCRTMVETANNDMLELMNRWQGFYLGGMQIHPGCSEFSCSEIDRMSAHGVRLIGEITPYIHGWNDYNTKELDTILDYATERNMIFSFHRADGMTEMIRRHPRLTIVKAHPGEGRNLDELIEMMKIYPNLMIDISGSGYDRYGMLKHLVDECGAERVLFGTDYPINNPATVLGCVMFEKITDSQREMILYGNAERILQL